MNVPINDWNGDWRKLDQSIIVYSVWSGEVFGGSDPKRIVKQAGKDSYGYYPVGDFSFELDLFNRCFVMWINNEKIILDASIGDFQYSPIVIFGYGPAYGSPEVTVL